MSVVRAACIQLCSGTDPAANLETVSALVRRAHQDGAEFICTPENTNILETRSRIMFERAVAEDKDETLRALCLLAAELQVWLLIGSLIVQAGRRKLANASYLVGPDGVVRTRYDKIHLFDVSLANGETYRESRTYRPGRDAVLADLPWGGLGMSICYDLRFPALFRLLARAGASFLTVPSAFTKVTGDLHWHTLLRARAIENGAFVLAPAQSGTHECGRETYGHSLIVDPWGRVLADGGEGVGHVIADLDLADLEDARARLPVLEHDRPIGLRS